MAKRPVRENGVPQVLHDMRCAYADPEEFESETVKEFRQMRKDDLVKFHTLMANHEDRWAAAKVLRDKAKEKEAPPVDVCRDPCLELVGKMLNEWEAKRAAETKP